MDKMQKIFNITGVSREDLESIGFEAEQITDEQMEIVASKMADYYLEYRGFWEDLESVAIDILGLSKKK